MEVGLPTRLITTSIYAPAWYTVLHSDLASTVTNAPKNRSSVTVCLLAGQSRARRFHTLPDCLPACLPAYLPTPPNKRNKRQRTRFSTNVVASTRGTSRSTESRDWAKANRVACTRVPNDAQEAGAACRTYARVYRQTTGHRRTGKNRERSVIVC